MEVGVRREGVRLLEDMEQVLSLETGLARPAVEACRRTPTQDTACSISGTPM